MKKYLSVLALVITLVIFTVAPVSAQDVLPVEIPETGAEEESSNTPAVPETGIAPSGRVAQNVAVFAGGSVIGLGIGFGIISVQKQLRKQEVSEDNLTNK